MNIQVQLPLMRDDDGDLEFYTSIQDLLADTEVDDVRNGVYDIFDIAGRSFLIVVTPGKGILANDQLALEANNSAISDPTEVCHRIERFLERLGYTQDELTEIAIEKRIGFCRQGSRR